MVKNLSTFHKEYLIYNLFIIFLFLFSLPYIIFKLAVNRRWRYGFWSRITGPKNIDIISPIWIHASSVGEVKIASILINNIKKIKPKQDIVLSVFTDTGISIAEREINGVPLFLMPFDIPYIVKRTIEIIKPKAFFIIESEFWPNLLYHMNNMGIPTVLINGRVSERSFKNYKMIRVFPYWFLNNISELSMRHERDASRIIELGADRTKVRVSGNLKFEGVVDGANRAKPDEEKGKLFLNNGDRVVIFGCTRDGEEEDIIPLVKALYKRYKGIILIVAPRHIERLPEIEILFSKEGIKFIKESSIKDGRYKSEDMTILVDRIGRLFPLYSICDLAVIGGSFRGFGGHNLLEPAVFGKPVLFGSYIDNFKEEADILLSSGGGMMLESINSLQTAIFELLDDKEKRDMMGRAAMKVIEGNCHAVSSNLNIIKKYI